MKAIPHIRIPKSNNTSRVHVVHLYLELIPNGPSILQTNDEKHDVRGPPEFSSRMKLDVPHGTDSIIDSPQIRSSTP